MCPIFEEGQPLAEQGLGQHALVAYRPRHLLGPPVGVQQFRVAAAGEVQMPQRHEQRRQAVGRIGAGEVIGQGAQHGHALFRRAPIGMDLPKSGRHARHVVQFTCRAVHLRRALQRGNRLVVLCPRRQHRGQPLTPSRTLADRPQPVRALNPLLIVGERRVVGRARRGPVARPLQVQQRLVLRGATAVVVGQPLDAPFRRPLHQELVPLQRLGHAPVQRHASRRPQVGLDHLTDDVVGKPIAARLWLLDQETRMAGGVERGGDVTLGVRGRCQQQRDLHGPADHRRRGKNIPRRRLQGDDALADALRQGPGDRRLAAAGLDRQPQALGAAHHKERHAGRALHHADP